MPLTGIHKTQNGKCTLFLQSTFAHSMSTIVNKKAVLSQGNRMMPQLFIAV